MNKPTIPSSFSDLSGSVSDAQIPSTVARDSELPDVSGFQTEAEVDARIAPYARATPSGTIADAQIPDDITRDSELTTHTNNHTAHGALTEGDIPAEIARDAEVTSAISTHTSDHDAHGAIVDADIPATIARDTEVDGKITTHNTATDSHSDIRTSIDDKADSSHTHLEADVTDLDHVDLPDAPEALADDTKYELSVESDGTQSWTVAAAPGSPDPTNLAISGRDADSLEVTSSTGTDATIPSATTSLAGLMSGADKTKLENVNSGAEENVQSDWSATEGDALILNKPTTITAAQTTKLAGIEDNATADQTATEIKTAYESNSDTNAYTDTEKSKLTGIAEGAQVNVGEEYTSAEKSKLLGIATGAEVNVKADWTETDPNEDSFIENKPAVITSEERTKLGGIETGATADQSAAEIKNLYESNSETNAFTDSEKSKLGSVAQGAEVNVQSDWDATSGDAVILNKPDLDNKSNTGHTHTEAQISDLAHTVDTNTTYDLSFDPDTDTITLAGNDGTEDDVVLPPTPAGDVKGDLIATSGALATTGDNNVYAATWTIESGIDFTVLSSNALRSSNSRPAAVNGVLVQAEVDGNVVGDVFTPWGGSGQFNRLNAAHGNQVLRISDSVSIMVSSGHLFTSSGSTSFQGSWTLALVSEGDTIPANTVVKVYYAVVRGAQGIAGSGGGGLSESEVDARVAAGVSDWAEEGNTSDIDESKIPDTITRDTELTAHTNNHRAHGAIVDADIPATIARDSEVSDAINAHTNIHAAHGAIVDADIPAGIARDTEVDGKITTHNSATDSHSDIRNAIPDVSGKSDVGHGHASTEITGLDIPDLPDAPTAEGKYELNVPNSGDATWTAAAEAGVPDPTNLALGTHDGDSLQITSSTGTNVEIPSATSSLAGLQSAADKVRLDNLNTNAEENVQSDWNISDSNSDAFIRNKPNLGGQINNRTGNYTIAVSDENDTVRYSGSVNATFNLPNITSPIGIGWSVIITNDSTSTLTIDANSTDTISGAQTLALESRRSVRLQVVGTTTWSIISDTLDINTQRSDSEIDARIAPYARTTPSGQIADAQIPSTIARDSEIPDVSNFQTETEVDARIAPYARAIPSGTIADAQIPDGITRDSELTAHNTASDAHSSIRSSIPSASAGTPRKTVRGETGNACLLYTSPSPRDS